MMTNLTHFIYKLQVTAIVLMVAGWGWAGGNFSSGLPLWNVLLHLVPLLWLLGHTLQFFRTPEAGQGTAARKRGTDIGISVFAIVTLIACTVLVVLGIANPNPDSVGVHNLWDWVSTIILFVGTFLWLGTLIPARRSQAAGFTAIND